MDFEEYKIQQELDEEYHKLDLAKFAEWLGKNKVKYDGVKIWKFPVSTNWKGKTNLYFSTEQLVEKFLKEN